MRNSSAEKLKQWLDAKVKEYNQASFIAADPVSVPHRFSKKQDIEIAGFFSAIFAWGNRTTIINKSNELMALMDQSPFAFCTGHTDRDLERLLHFKHRTFNATDLLYFIAFFRLHYSRHQSLETAFTLRGASMEERLAGFHQYFFSLEEAPPRTKKHIASPERGSTCKRLNMYLRWMVRRDDKGIDFGLWKKIAPADLICPVDLHVARVARRLGIIKRKQTDWLTALELTGYLRTLDPQDPVKYDFALFSLGVTEKY
ncbi:MAG: TIGR02757 family protein [Sphingobacteriales bacterium]|nr:TIGR02757 family protein [Sphingobacteriales bacterium]